MRKGQSPLSSKLDVVSGCLCTPAETMTMPSPASNIPCATNNNVTPHTGSAPNPWNTPEFHRDSAMVAQQLRDGVVTEAALEEFLAFLAGPSGNRVLTYDRECHEGVKQMICGLRGLSRVACARLNRICENQGWMCGPV